MSPTHELRVRSDWQLIRLFYLPLAAIGAIPLEPCAFCKFLGWWGHHVEEWVRRKALFRIAASGLDYEDGGRPVHFAWSEISAIAIHRRNRTPVWRTNGSFGFTTPPFWLVITVARGTAEQTICVWPRQVVGGLPAPYRFARALQAALVQAAARGEAPSRLPDKGRAELTRSYESSAVRA